LRAGEPPVQPVLARPFPHSAIPPDGCLNVANSSKSVTFLSCTQTQNGTGGGLI
jgi:hypothetical protein